VFLIRFGMGMLGGIQNDPIRCQIRKGVDTVGYQGLGLGRNPKQNLEHTQQQINHRTDQSDFHRFPGADIVFVSLSLRLSGR
jgi:hypothetical protein